MGSMLDSLVDRFTGAETVPLFRPHLALALAVNYPPNVVIPRGTLLAPVSGGNVNDVQTLTVSGTPTGGTFTLTGTRDNTSQTTVAIAYNATAAVVQAALTALGIFGSGNVAVTGSAGGPWTVTFQGALAAGPIPPLTLGTNALTGGSSPTVGIVHTTTGQSGGTMVAWPGSGNAAVAVQRFDIATDASGNITFGNAATGGFWGETELSACAWFTGEFSCADLIGLVSVPTGMRLLMGTISAGILKL